MANKKPNIIVIWGDYIGITKGVASKKDTS